MTDFGPAVIGKEAFEKQQKAKQGGGDRFGPLVLEHNRSRNRPASVPEVKIVEGDVSSLSVKDLEALLEKDAGLVLELLDAELARPDVRISALRALQYAEKSKPIPSATILGRIDEAKAELEGGEGTGETGGASGGETSAADASGATGEGESEAEATAGGEVEPDADDAGGEGEGGTEGSEEE